MSSPIGSVERIYEILAGIVPSKGPNDYGVLATCDADETAYARFVVLRGFDAGANQLWVNTHVGTEKVAHLRHAPDAEVALWLSRKRVQLRLRATWRVVDAALAGRNPVLGKLREEAWEDQPASTKRMYGWPRGGEPLGKKRKVTGWDGEGVPPAFAVLLGTLYQIDALRLVRGYHERWVHKRPRQVWVSERVTA